MKIDVCATRASKTNSACWPRHQLETEAKRISAHRLGAAAGPLACHRLPATSFDDFRSDGGHQGQCHAPAPRILLEFSRPLHSIRSRFCDSLSSVTPEIAQLRSDSI